LLELCRYRSPLANVAANTATTALHIRPNGRAFNERWRQNAERGPSRFRSLGSTSSRNRSAQECFECSAFSWCYTVSRLRRHFEFASASTKRIILFFINSGFGARAAGDDHHRALRVTNDMLGYAPDERMLESRAAMSGSHD
jgi:hypothetical protein